MLNDKDIQKLIDVFATREEINNLVTKEDLHKAVSKLHDAIDAYAKKADTYFQEMVMLAHKVDRLEKWIYQIAEKVNLELKP